jgi:hypothetical protein
MSPSESDYVNMTDRLSRLFIGRELWFVQGDSFGAGFLYNVDHSSDSFCSCSSLDDRGLAIVKQGRDLGMLVF